MLELHKEGIAPFGAREMNIAKGQIWKRKSFDQYIVITSKSKKSMFSAKCIAGSDPFSGYTKLGDHWFPEHCNMVYPVLCIKCGTARARLNLTGRQYAKGLLCWSCNGN